MFKKPAGKDLWVISPLFSVGERKQPSAEASGPITSTQDESIVVFCGLKFSHRTCEPASGLSVSSPAQGAAAESGTRQENNDKMREKEHEGDANTSEE